jgi:hypothetical protein
MSKIQFNVRIEQTLAERINRAADAHGSKEKALAAAFDALERPTSAAPAKPALAPAASPAFDPMLDLPAALEAGAIELRKLRRLSRFAKPEA